MSVVVPYLDDVEMLRACLTSVHSQTWSDYELIIVDNGSGDPTLEQNRAGFRKPIIIRNPRNEGFAKAVNQGYRVCRGEFLLVLNSDVVVAPNYLECCIGALNEDSKIAGVSGKLLKLDHERVIDSTGHILFGDRRVKDRGEWEPDRGQFDRDEEVFSFPATAALYRTDALDDIEAAHGEVFDEDFFAYVEDVDLAWRLRLRGWTLAYVHRAEASHRRLVSGGHTPTAVLVWDMRNRYLMMVKIDSFGSLVRHLWEIAFTKLRLFAYFLLRRPVVPFRAWAGFVRLLPRAIRKRRAIQGSRKISWRELEPWFQTYDYWSFIRRLRNPPQ